MSHRLSQVATAGTHGGIRIWDFQSCKLLQETNISEQDPVASPAKQAIEYAVALRFVPDLRLLIAGTSNGRIILLAPSLPNEGRELHPIACMQVAPEAPQGCDPNEPVGITSLEIVQSADHSKFRKLRAAAMSGGLSRALLSMLRSKKAASKPGKVPNQPPKSTKVEGKESAMQADAEQVPTPCLLYTSPSPRDS